MKKILQAVEKVFRKGFWLYKNHLIDIKKEARKNFGGNESAFMRHIISNWFNK